MRALLFVCMLSVCMYVWLYACTFVGLYSSMIYVCMCLCLHVRMLVFSIVCLYVCVVVHVHACMLVCLHVRMLVFITVCVNVCLLCTCVCVSACVSYVLCMLV